ALVREGDLQAWLPYDTPGAVRRFLRRHRPALGVLMETEVWPNLLAQARAAALPMVLANARLSERSLAKGRRLQALMRPAVAAFDCVLAQTARDGERLRELGAPRVVVAGNLKFDASPDPLLIERGQGWRRGLGRPVILATSTREGEEEPLLEAWKLLPAPRPLLLLVPRHPQRFDLVAAMLAPRGLSFLRRSGWGAAPPAEAAAADVWLGDSLGEMPLYYAAADAALLGGSFERLGGHNLIEAAACGCPLVMGPHTFNFAQAAELALQARAALRAPDIEQAVQTAVALALDPARGEWARRALDFAGQHRGAAERMAAEIVALIQRR
ncbi:MAG: 3-deoxy-D-manno-octulosonic acid transferase, partial [Burkholderiales bacterium]|nr:3-deoxy-D-manno-octulosonic acid transferase [Burkholderiales bacterium]